MAAELKALQATDRQFQLELREAVKRDGEEQSRLQKESTEARKATMKGKRVVNRPITTLVEEEVEEVV